MTNTSTQSASGMAHFLRYSGLVIAIPILAGAYNLAYGGGSYTYACGGPGGSVTSWTCSNASANPPVKYSNVPFHSISGQSTINPGTTYKIGVSPMNSITLKGGCGYLNSAGVQINGHITGGSTHSDDSKVVCTALGSNSQGVEYQCTSTDPSKTHDVRISMISCKQ